MGLFLGTSEPSKIFVGDTSISKVFLGDTQVRPSEWQPGANTLLYLPLNSTDTYTDKSGLNRSTTNTGVTFGTYQGVDCGQFDRNRHIQVNTLYAHNFPITILVWAHNTGVYPNTTDGKIYDARNSNESLITSYDVAGGRGWEGSSGGYYFSSNWNYQNQWVLAAFVFTSTSITRYVKNSSHDLSQTIDISTLPNFTPTYINIGNEWNNGASRYFIGGMSQLIVENKARTSQEISNYYNQTKGNYGL